MKKWLVAGIGIGTAVASAGIVGAGAPGNGAGPVGIELSVLGTYASGVFEEGAAEIVAHDPARQRVFVVNADAATVDVLDVTDPTTPTLEFSLGTESVVPGGTANSVALRGDLLAVAVEAATKTDPGAVVFFDAADLSPTSVPTGSVTVGALPDMVTFTPDGRYLLVANEGEPSANYGIYEDGLPAWTDPAGSISVITMPRQGLPTAANVRTAGFEAWDPGGTRVLPQGVRIFGPEDAPLVSANLEPEYIAVDGRSRTAYVSLQEANAFAIVDIRTARVTRIEAFGLKDHSRRGNELDASDRDGIDIRNRPVLGMYQPDGIASYEVRGKTYLVTANEGDARDYTDEGDYIEESRFRAATESCDPAVDPSLRDNTSGIGRLTITIATDDPCDGVAHAFGARSFSIWSETGELVFDSGADFERIVAADVPDFFNSDHAEANFDNRSDNKGPEPEGVVLGRIAGRTYAFIGLERVGGIMVYDISSPRQPRFVQYLNNRDFDADPESPEAGDLGPEGLAFVDAVDSPTGRPMLVVGNEVSGTTTLYDIALTTPGNGPGR